jgi:hypothetical protein
MTNQTPLRVLGGAALLLWVSTSAQGQAPPGGRLRVEAVANTPMSNLTMVWKDEASANRAMAVLMDRSARPEAVVPPSSCTIQNGTRLSLVDMRENGAVVVVLNGPETGCRGYISAVFMSDYKRY